jgi:DNA repair exonuclease SbcCD ATPase subunit
MEELVDLDERLEKLEAEERELSLLRAKLHDRLSSFDNAETERRERELSDRRKALHDEIDRLRAQRDVAPGQR